jgi:hypothetical protein
VAGTRAGRNPAADSRAERNPAADTRAADNLLRPLGEGTLVDQAIRVAVRAVRQVVPSPVNAPDVVAHEPILSTGGAFLNVPPISVA